MNDFQKALEALQANDLAFLAPDPATPDKPQRRRNKTTGERNESGGGLASPVLPTGNETDRVAPQAATVLHEKPYGEHKLPVFVPPEQKMRKEPTTNVAADPNSTAPLRKRLYVEREWPAIGTILSGTYYGVVYRAEVIPANKRLKSGKQLRILDGPAKGKRVDSFTKALLVATARQRREGKLGRSGATNGWSFWLETTSVSGSEPEATA